MANERAGRTRQAAARYRERANKMKAQAAEAKYPEARTTLLALAEGYDRVADEIDGKRSRD